ncbi:MAG: hypothetical protein M3299_10285 [Thermoproteota archaeon]|nr:hypothetical protein [Thermoproteota archaeon]
MTATTDTEKINKKNPDVSSYSSYKFSQGRYVSESRRKELSGSRRPNHSKI